MFLYFLYAPIFFRIFLYICIFFHNIYSAFRNTRGGSGCREGSDAPCLRAPVGCVGGGVCVCVCGVVGGDGVEDF